MYADNDKLNVMLDGGIVSVTIVRKVDAPISASNDNWYMVCLEPSRKELCVPECWLKQYEVNNVV